jgi:hypothetical protein
MGEVEDRVLNALQRSHAGRVAASMEVETMALEVVGDPADAQLGRRLRGECKLQLFERSLSKAEIDRLVHCCPVRPASASG